MADQQGRAPWFSIFGFGVCIGFRAKGGRERERDSVCVCAYTGVGFLGLSVSVGAADSELRIVRVDTSSWRFNEQSGLRWSGFRV